MKILDFEDNIYKYIDIKSVAERCRIESIERSNNLEDGFEKIVEAEKNGKGYNLIITDLHYPMAPNSDADVNTGEKLVEKLKENNLNIPVIVCSSINKRIDNVYGSVWYSNLSDWDIQLEKMIKQLKEV